MTDLAARVVELEDLVLRLAWRIWLCHEILARLAEKDSRCRPDPAGVES